MNLARYTPPYVANHMDVNFALGRLRGGDPRFESKIFHHDLSPDWTPESGRALRYQWWRKHGERAKKVTQRHMNFDPAKKLRVGYVSGDFLNHSASAVFGHMILAQESTVESVCYSSTPPNKYDHVTQRFQDGARWRDVFAMADWELANLIARDGIDILIDCSGYTSGNRMPVFAMRPAHIQLSGWGYGIPHLFRCFDGIIGDPVSIPQEHRNDIEPVIDMPCVIPAWDRSFLPPPNALPCLTKPPVFGSFNRQSKIDDGCLRLWAKILDRVPGSTLVLKAGDYKEDRQAHIRSIVGDRVSFPGKTSSLLHAAAYQHIDLSLDPIVQNGGVGSCESLWMGVPVLTLYGGKRYATPRAGAALMHAVGLPNFAVKTEQEYEDAAVELVTTERDQLASVRASLRGVMIESKLNKGYLRAMEDAYRALWRRRCLGVLNG